MANVKFKYNPKTIRYESASISLLTLAGKAFGYLTFGGMFFVGLVLLQNFLFDTDLEKQLRAENEELSKHKIVLTSRLQASAGRINQLKNEDKALYEKLFESKAEGETSDTNRDKEEIITADPPIFAEWMSSATKQSDELYKTAKLNNKAFSESASIEKHEIKILKSLPTAPPIENFEVDKLVSGFGKRINPFHKGLYPHDGVDIAATTETNVVAGGPGIVLALSHSNLLAGFGNYIEIDHQNGIVTSYAHLGEIKISYGQRVSKGQVIGTVGSSGGSIAPHLHYEVIKDGKNINPVKYLIGGLNSDQYQLLVNNSQKQNQSLD